jgi:hypothetical protein
MLRTSQSRYPCFPPHVKPTDSKAVLPDFARKIAFAEGAIHLKMSQLCAPLILCDQKTTVFQ